MAKKSKKKKKNRNVGLGAGAAATAIATEIIGNMLGQVLADGLERYMGSADGKKKLKKRWKKLTSQHAS